MYFKNQLVDYVCTGNVSGSFMSALLTNNLYEAVHKADDTNKLQLVQLVDWIFNHLPVGSYGTFAEVRRWSNHQGLQGKGGDETIVRWKMLNEVEM